jgi:hypothetical protein
MDSPAASFSEYGVQPHKRPILVHNQLTDMTGTNQRGQKESAP